MSAKHPIISVTGSSGSGTTSVRQTFEQIFRREQVQAVFIEGDAFHRYDREAMKAAVNVEEGKGNFAYSHFGPDANLLGKLEEVFTDYAETGKVTTRHYAHDLTESDALNTRPGTFTPWETTDADSDLLLYEGLHGAVVTETINTARHADFRIGVVPVINLEWIQKIHRDRSIRGYSTEAVIDVILRRMPDYARYICPQFTQTDINFQRVPTVDTSNPFAARWVPTADESMVIIRFANPHGIDFRYLISMVQNSFMSRANSIVIPGAKLDLAMQLILTPFILKLVDRRRRML